MTAEAQLEAGGEGAARLAAEIAEAERQERERLAEALHDDALQRLLAARQDLAEAEGDPGALEAVQRQLDELTASLRSLTKAMHEDALASLPLASALERLAEDGARRGRLVVHTHVAPAATGDHDAFVLGVARELLTNVVKHASASSVDIAITREGEAVVIRVADDGRGMAAGDVERAGRDGHMGHARLRRRLVAIGGSLELDSSPGAGTAVTCVLPLQNLQAQRTLEDALRRERRWSSAVVAAMQDGFVVIRDGVVVQVNDRFCAMTGYSHAELTLGAADAAPFWPPGERPRLEALARGARSADGAEAQTAILRRDGTSFPALVAARAIHEGDGGDAGLLVTVKDISELEIAAERRRLELELAAVVATTTRLRGLLDTARAVTDEAGLGTLLREVARTISKDLGWAVVINLYRPAWDDFVVAAGHGIPHEGWAVLEGATYTWAEWTPLLDDRYQRRGGFVVPAGEPVGEEPGGVRWPVPSRPSDGPDAWRAGDDLLIPLRHSHGHFLGILSLDAPVSGRRPTDAELDVIVAIAGHAGLAVQHAQVAIETARHSRALNRLLHVSSRIAATRELEPMLEVVARGISEALGFERVVIEVVGADGSSSPRAWHDRVPGLEERGAAGPVRPEELAMVLDPAFEVAGCYLLGRDEAEERLPAARRAMLGSRRNGRGWRAWDDHVVLVPLRAADDEVVGVVWVGDPEDRLLPAGDRLKVLRAFANQATAALIVADRHARLHDGAPDGPGPAGPGDRGAFLRELEREAARADAAAVLVLAEVEGWAAPQDGAAPGRDALAEAFAAELRPQDRAVRLEGALVGLLLPGCRPLEARAAIRRIAARLEPAGAGQAVHVHVGLAELGPRAEPAAAVLGRAADSLLTARRRRPPAAR